MIGQLYVAISGSSIFTCSPGPAYSVPLFRIIEHIRQVTAATVLTVVHRSHEDTRTARLGRTLPPQALDLAITIHLVVLEHGQLGLLALMLDLLRSGVDLLLPLLGATTQTEDEMEG